MGYVFLILLVIIILQSVEFGVNLQRSRKGGGQFSKFSMLITGSVVFFNVALLIIMYLNSLL